MDIKAYIAILWGKKWVILATLVVTVIVVTLGTFLATPIYSATATLRVATASTSLSSSADYMYADRLLNTYTQIATSKPLLAELVTKLGLQIAPQLTVETIPDTELIQISVESPSPKIAQAAANTLAEILVAQSKELYTGSGKSPEEILGEQVAQAEADLYQAWQNYDNLILKNPSDSAQIEAANQAIQLKQGIYSNLLNQYEQAHLREELRANIISVVEPADLPLSPSKPKKVINIGLGFIVGLIGGVGLAFLFENLDSRLYTSEQIEAAAEVPSIGKIPAMPGWGPFKSKNANAPVKEAFRRMRTKILAQNQTEKGGKQLKTLLITSAEPGEGKSTVVTNLAIALAQAGQKVAVVDGDLRIPSQHKNFNLPNESGLSSVLDSQAKLEAALQDTHYEDVSVLTSGPLPSNPAELLGSPQMKALINCLRSQYDMVLLDAPAILAVADATVLAPLVDGVALVARRNFIKEQAVQEAVKQLVESKTCLIGVVVNDAEKNGAYYYYHH